MVFCYILALSAAFPVCLGFDFSSMSIGFDGPNEYSQNWSKEFEKAFTALCRTNKNYGTITMTYDEGLDNLINKAQQSMTTNAYIDSSDDRVYKTQGLKRGSAKDAAQEFVKFLEDRLSRSYASQMLRHHRHFKCVVFEEGLQGLSLGQPFIYCAFKRTL